MLRILCFILAIIVQCEGTKIGLMNGNIKCNLPEVNVGSLHRNLAFHVHIHCANGQETVNAVPLTSRVLVNPPSIDPVPIDPPICVPEQLKKPIYLDSSNDQEMLGKYPFLNGKTIRIARNVSHNANETDSTIPSELMDSEPITTTSNPHGSVPNAPSAITNDIIPDTINNQDGPMVQFLTHLLTKSNLGGGNSHPLATLMKYFLPSGTKVNVVDKSQTSSFGAESAGVANMLATVIRSFAEANETIATGTRELNNSEKKEKARMLREKKSEERRLRKLAMTERLAKMQKPQAEPIPIES